MPEPVYTEALESQAAKRHLPTSARTRLLQQLPGVVRARARFSATMVHSAYLGEIDSVIDRSIRGELDTATALLDLDRSLQSLGFPGEAGRGSLTRHRSYARRKLIVDTNLAQAGNYGQFIHGQSPGALHLYPCWEYYRAFNRQEPRNWQARWLAAGGRLYQGRMIATKDDPIWVSSVLNRLGTPYPPYDFNSGMRLRSVPRAEAIELGVIARDTDVMPSFEEFRAESMAAANASGGLQSVVEEALQGIARFDAGGVLRMIERDDMSSLGLSSAGTWTGPGAPGRIRPQEARQRLGEGVAALDYRLRPRILDEQILGPYADLTSEETDLRLERLPEAIEAMDQPDEHWQQSGVDIYLKVWGERPRRSGAAVIVDPQGRVQAALFSGDDVDRLDVLRRGTLIRGREVPQP